MKRDLVTVYHITPHWNIAPILHQGILPDKSRGKLPVVWLVDQARVTWALAHVSARWSVAVDGLTVLTCQLDREALIKTAWEGVYQARQRVKADKASPYDLFLE